ncbi:MAG: BamA/TamA family outer membrane protein [Gammaproteobacteria bacterium]
MRIRRIGSADPLFFSILLGLALSAAMPEAVARENLDTEIRLSDALMMPGSGRASRGRKARPEPEGTRAILPQVGYSPDKGANAGIKYTDRSLGAGGLTVDLGAIYSEKGRQEVEFAIASPHLLNDWMMASFEANFMTDPTYEFFGLGNNDIGPEPLSTHRYQATNALFSLAFRPFNRLLLVASVGFADTFIGTGKLEDEVPATVDAFPTLVGTDGGRTNPVALSLVFNNREDITRPSRGWRFIAKAQHVNRALDNDFQFTRYILDASYLLPLLTRRQVLGFRVGGQFIDGDSNEIPFFELASLGGSEDLRGFFQDRFLGKHRIMVNLEYRLKLFDFHFFDWTRVRIDGVLFGDAGRVFQDDELSKQFAVNKDLLGRLVDDFQYSYGGGTRIALGQAILARIDVGFSEEESGLVYLTFGHIF